eukprot:SAG31_NODE_1060_length_10111_cov_17.871354_4_plen_427_part_00
MMIDASSSSAFRSICPYLSCATTPPHVIYVCAGLSIFSDVESLRIASVTVLIKYICAQVSATAREVRFLPEADAADRPGVYAWDTSAYQWLDKTFASQVVPVGSRATRQLPEIGLSCSRSSAVASADALSSCYASSVEESTGIVTLRFDDALSLRAELKPKTRVFLKHFGNMQAWGIVAFNSSNVSVIGSTLWSISGMGYRADFCTQRYLLKDSHVELKPGTVRPMSITADATHWMHHSGEILMDSCSFQGQGDDGCNPHGNFIVIVRATDRNTVEYISERGPGWVGDAPTHMIGDEVQFFSRGTLQRIDDASSEGSVIVAATESSVTFSRPLPAKAKPFDMFLSLKRVASLKMRRCFFGNSNARGIVLSAVNATIEDCRFVCHVSLHIHSDCDSEELCLCCVFRPGQSIQSSHRHHGGRLRMYSR